jgi:hypothetical protein
MNSASQALYRVTSTIKLARGDVCQLCGGDGYPVREYRFPDTFTDYPVMRPGAGVCAACEFWMTDTDYLRILLGKDKPQFARNYSLFLAEGTLAVLSKAQKRIMAELLYDFMPEVAIIATSGQKHLVFKARLNPLGESAGWLLFEESHVWFNCADYAVLMPSVLALYNAGYTKTQIMSGEYRFAKAFDLALWEAHEDIIRPARGSALLDVCIYLATKQAEEEQVDE